jgi:hypothetical protein
LLFSGSFILETSFFASWSQIEIDRNKAYIYMEVS